MIWNELRRACAILQTVFAEHHSCVVIGILALNVHIFRGSICLQEKGATMTRIGTSLIESLQGSFEFGTAFVTPFLRPKRSRWGATDEEIENAYPGDELIPEPKWSANHAISIHATPNHVWPWIAQIGQGRGGFYSYQKLENLTGCEIENTSHILEKHQHIRVGDPIKLHVEAPPMTVAIVEKPTALVLYGNPAEADDSAVLSTSWAFLLLGQPDGASRLLSRTRYHHNDDFLSKLAGGQLLVEPISFVMEPKMLTVIKALVESSQG